MPLVIVSVCFFITGMTMIQRPGVQERDLQVQMKKYFLELATLRDFRTICFVLCLLFMCLNTLKIAYTLTTFVYVVGYLDIDCLILRIFKSVDMTATFFFYGAKIYLYMGFSSMFRAKLKQGFVTARLRMKNCCRKMCTCGRRWSPVAPKDSQRYAGALQGQHTSLMNSDDTEGRKKSGSDLPRPVTRDTHKTTHGSNSYTEAQDKSLDGSKGATNLYNRDESELSDARPARKAKGNNQKNVTGTKV